MTTYAVGPASSWERIIYPFVHINMRRLQIRDLHGKRKPITLLGSKNANWRKDCARFQIPQVNVFGNVFELKGWTYLYMFMFGWAAIALLLSERSLTTPLMYFSFWLGGKSVRMIMWPRRSTYKEATKQYPWPTLIFPYNWIQLSEDCFRTHSLTGNSPRTQIADIMQSRTTGSKHRKRV